MLKGADTLAEPITIDQLQTSEASETISKITDFVSLSQQCIKLQVKRYNTSLTETEEQTLASLQKYLQLQLPATNHAVATVQKRLNGRGPKDIVMRELKVFQKRRKLILEALLWSPF